MSAVPPPDIQQPVTQVLASGNDDWVHAQEVVWHSMHGDLSEGGKRRAVRVLRYLFVHRLMVPGDLGETGFEDWPGDVEAWEERAVAHLESLDWAPLGAGFWLRLIDDV